LCGLSQCVGGEGTQRQRTVSQSTANEPCITQTTGDWALYINAQALTLRYRLSQGERGTWKGTAVLAKVLSSTLLGVDAWIIEVEVDLAHGLPTFTTVGLPDVSIRESRDRVKAAMANSGFPFPLKRITVNLAPAHLRKEGTAFDLPIALGLLQAAGYIQAERLQRYLVVGELSLDGRVKAVTGAMPMALALRQAGLEGMVVPAENAAEAAVIEDVPVFGVATLAQAIGFFNGTESIPRTLCDVPALFQQQA